MAPPAGSLVSAHAFALCAFLAAGRPHQFRCSTAPHRLDTIDLQQSVQVLQVTVGDQGHGNTGATHAAGSTRPVRVGLVAQRCLIVDHVTHMPEVE